MTSTLGTPELDNMQDFEDISEHDCIDMKCTHYDGDMCTLGFCEPDSLEVE